MQAKIDNRNQFVDIMRGIAMLLVVLGHTMTGCTVDSQKSFLFNIIWSLQMIMGKSLFSGRQGTFTDYLSLLRTNFQWIVGNLGEASFANAHNAPLAHLCSTGLLGTILFYGMMLKKTLACCENDNPVARTALICILGLFIQSSGEASIFLGGFPGIEFVYVLFYLAGRKEPL